MSLIVENGTGLSTAESYASVSSADTRLTSLGNTTWSTITTAEKEEALRRATRYMVQSYRSRWIGARSTSVQALDWPRTWVMIDGYPINANVVPADISNACIDLALKAAAGDLAPDLDRTVIREKVGPLETEYAPHGTEYVRYRSIDMALAPYLNGGGPMMALART
jgi:hypothetical protein